MRKAILSGLCLLVFLLAGTTAHADTVNMTLMNVNPGNYDLSLSNFYVYPYNFSINGSQSLISLMCDDFNDDISIGESWTANVNSFGDIIAGKGQLNPTAGNPLTSGSLEIRNGLTTKQAYEDAAWLYQQLEADDTAANAVGINHTVWALFATTSFYNNPTVQYWYGLASAATSGLTDAQAVNMFSNVEFFTPVPDSQSEGGLPQEFIGISTPEPSSIALLLTGLAGIAVVARRKQQTVK